MDSTSARAARVAKAGSGNVAYTARYDGKELCTSPPSDRMAARSWLETSALILTRTRPSDSRTTLERNMGAPETAAAPAACCSFAA